MAWNWQQPDWPRFQWDRARIEAAERLFLVSGGVFVGTLRHLGSEERDQLNIEAMSTEAVATSEIEGEILDRAHVQSSIRRQLGLSTDERRVRPAERGIAEMMVDLYRSFAEPLSQEMLFRWHAMVMSGRRERKMWDGIEPVMNRCKWFPGRYMKPRCILRRRPPPVYQTK
jgi:Fic family protein